jgi:glycine/serine hydroxymethyltransferase
MGEPEMAEIAALIATVLREPDDQSTAEEVREASGRLCSKFTPYPDLVQA